ncbi:hypothetical protein EXE43_04105 [Halorubrum sp. SS5]|nr:hypothetical protein EXE43_04105 [Halorubrum sp. SS5]
MVTTATLLRLVGVAVLCATFVSAALRSRGRLPFAPSEGLFVAVSVGGISLVAQTFFDSDAALVAVMLVGCLAWAIGYEVGRGDAGG